MPKKDCLLWLDFLGRKQNFTIGGKRSYQTYIGSGLSVVIIVVCMYFFFYFGLSVLKRKNLNIIVTEHYEEKPPLIKLTKEDFVLALSLQLPNYTLYLDETIYTVKASLVTITKYSGRSDSFDEKEIKIIKCTNFKFNLTSNYFNALDKENLYCLAIEEDYFLEGNFGDEVWSYISIRFYKCTNSTGTKCKNEEEIDSILSGGYVGLFVSDTTVYPNNFNSPSHTYGKNIFATFSASKYLDFWIFMKQVEIKTDHGFILDSYKNQKHYAYDYTRETTDLRKTENFLTVKLRASQKREVYLRKYEKLQTIIATLGGIIHLLIVVGEIISFFFSEMIYRQYIISFFAKDEGSPFENSVKDMGSFLNKNLTFGLAQEHHEVCIGNNNEKMSTTGKKIFPTNKSFQNSSIIYLNQSPNGNKNHLIKKKRRRRTSSSCGYFLLLYPFSRNIQDKFNNINFVYNKMSYMFDVIEYLKVQNDLSLLKRFFFQKDLLSFYKVFSYKFQLKSAYEKILFLEAAERRRRFYENPSG